MFLRINYLRHNHFYDLPAPEGQEFKRGDFVILKVMEEEGERLEVGKVVFMHDMETAEANPPELVRKAEEKDLRVIADRQKEEEQAFSDFVKKVLKHKLDMKPVSVFISFDGKFADFLFAAEERVDFRELVKDLASKHKRKIFLKQIGDRERAAVSDGCGSCGRKLCCSTFLRDRLPVTMTAIRGQDLYSRDRDKLTGLCGKLKCCLNYELYHYEELAKKFPRMKAKVGINGTNREGIVIGRSILDQMVRVAFDNEEGVRPEMHPLSDITVLSRGKAA